jgi:alcohol dehydrogenase class IV
MKGTAFLMPKVLLQGPGSMDKLGKEIQRIGCKKAFLVTDKIMQKAGYVGKLTTILDEAKISYVIYDGVTGEPQDTFVYDGLEVYKNEGCDFLIALGGGSPIDTAKAIGILANNGGKITEYMGADKVAKPTPPVVAIATTSGTGSEVTKFTIIADTENDVKMLIGSPFVMPDIAVADPVLTLSVPEKTTAATGLDAFCHAIEAYVSKKATPMTDKVALAAIELISKNLRKAWCNGDDVEARSNMMLASTLAGMSFNNSSVTLIHGMSRPIGANFHFAHGISNAVLLPTWAEFTYMAVPEKFAKVAEAMGENVEGLSDMDAALIAVDAIKRLCEDVEVPSIQEMGVKKEDFEKVLEKMAHDAVVSGSPANNPRNVDEKQIVELYRKAF